MKPTIQIYRLEDAEHNGPFFAEQKTCKYLTPHRDPEKSLEGSELTLKDFKKLIKAQYIFGWVSDELYHQFFKRVKQDGEKKCYSLGMRKIIYTTNDYFLLSDGQVIFNPNSPSIDVTPTLKNKIKKTLK